MIPVLYASDETVFTSNGLGLLYDCIDASCIEERNGQYEISFTYPLNGLHFSEIEHSCFIKAVPSDGANPQLFRIYYSSKPSNGKVQFKAEHVSYQQKHIPVEPYTATNAAEALTGIAEHARENCPFEFWTDNTNAGDFSLEQPASARSIIGGMRGSILDVYGGEYMFDNYLVRLYRQRGQDNGVTLRYGKNITDIKQEKNIAETITGVMPYWYGQNENQENVYVSLPEKVIHSSTAANYPYQRTIVLDCSGEWQDPPTEAQLRGYAQSYITQTGIGIPKISIDVSFVALWQTEEYKDIANLERVRLCDTVTVEFEPLGISAKAKVVKTEYDILKERYRSIELGDARTNFAGQVKADIDASSAEIVKKTVTPSFLQREINRATELIRGGLGGYVVFTSNADGQPQEIIIMDTDDVQTAVQCIRINKNGIGFSTTGYNGPYTSAWTIDGRFNADFIATGSLTANLIKGGILKLGGTDNGNGVIQVFDGSNNLVGKWDKDGLSATGDLEMKKGDIYGLVGSVPYLTWLLVEGQARLDILDGFSVKKESTSLISSHSIIPRSDRVLDQTLASTKILKSFVFTSDIETSGNMFYLEIDKKSFTLYPARYGTASAVSQAPEVSIDGDGISVKSGGATISAKSGSGVSGDGEIHISAPSKTTGHNSTQADMDYSSILLQSGSRNQKIDINGNGLSIRANGASIYLNGSNSSQSALQLMGGNKGLRIDGSVAQITSDGGSSWSQLAFASSSSKRYKHGIKPLSEDRDSHRLLALPVVEFDWNTDHPLQYEDMRGKTVPGIIAEDVADIYPSAVIHNADGDVESWDERRIIPGMLALIQEQDKKIKDLEARLARLEELLT